MAKNNKDLFVGGFAKLLKEQLQVDVRLKASDSDDNRPAISVHKIVLFARSEVFKKLLEPDEVKISTELETITLSDMKHEELKAFIDFIYSDGSALSTNAKKHVRSLYVAADKYMIPHLRDLCRNELISSLNPSNALGIIELAQIPFDGALNFAAVSKVIPNIINIVSSNEFKLFMVKHPNLAVELVKISLTRPNSSPPSLVPQLDVEHVRRARSIGNRIYGYCNCICSFFGC